MQLNATKQLLSKFAKYKVLLGIVVLILTTVLFIQFFRRHPDYIKELAHISPWTVMWVLLLNVLMLVVLVQITAITLALCNKKIGLKENFLITSYSSIANFFGPLQSGPGVRAVYFKTRLKVRLRDYTFASLIALSLFAFFSALFLFVGMRPWWQTILVLGGVLAIGVVAIKKVTGRGKFSPYQFSPRLLALSALVVLALAQVAITACWYYVELQAVNPQIGFSQAMSYAGAANFSLFVSITPDGIGVREAFLLFSQHIHHVPTADIVSANIIDRGAYVLFLSLLFLVAVGFHAKDRLHLNRLARVVPKDEPQSD